MIACFFQLRRAFFHVFFFIVGRSPAAARLRAAAWESIFTHDLRRYQRSLYRHLGDVTTLITGPSGTGKELVARAIGLSRYVPFDGQAGRFVENFHEGFHAVNLSALSPTLIESELFGHRRGAFTGAVADRVGWLESCPANGSVFLDEIGELDPAIQVKLLRVLQRRTFQRLGDTADRRFPGKILAATNRDLVAEIDGGAVPRRFLLSAVRRSHHDADAAGAARRVPGGSGALADRECVGGWRPRRRSRWPARWRRGSASIWGRATLGPATCASWSSAFATS